MKSRQQLTFESPPAETDLTGYNMIDLATFNVIINDFIRITGVSFGAVLGVLYFVFRDRRKMMMPIVPVMFALVWMLGLGGWLGANLTIISMVSAAMIMGLGIDFGIHVTKKYYSTNGGKEGMSETMVELSRGLLGGSITTGIGFLFTAFANLSGMHALGIFLFTGIISAYIGAVVLLPVLIIMIESEKKNIMKMTTKTKTKLVTTLIAFTLFSGAVSAVPELDAVSFDPGFVSAGDSVNISANMHETGYPDKVWDGDKRITMVLKPGNRLAREHSIIVDDRDKSIGFLYPEGVWNQNYRESKLTVMLLQATTGTKST